MRRIVGSNSRFMLVLLIVSAFLCVSTDYARQLVRVKGEIIDDVGALFPNTTITLKNKQGKYRTKTDEKGIFDMFIPEGNYDISVEVQGCKRYKPKRLVVATDREMKVDIILKCAPTPIYE